MRKTITFYSILYMLFLVLQKGAGFLTKIVMANSITPFEYGIITLVAITIPSLLGIVTNLNFYEMLSHSEHGRKYFGFTLIASLTLAVISSILLYIFSDRFFSYLNLPPDQSGLYLMVIIISMFSVAAVADFAGVFTGMKLYSAPGILMALPSISRFAIVCILMWTGVTSVSIYILVFSLSNIIPLLYIAILEPSRSLMGMILPIQVPSLKMFGFGLSVFLATNFTIFTQLFVRIVVSHELGVEWQGLYDVSQTIVTVMLFAISTMAFITVPEATSSDRRTLKEDEGLGGLARGLFALLFFFAALLIFYSEFLVVTIFSADYAPAAEYVYILAIGNLFLFIQVFLSQVNLSWATRGREYALFTIIPLCLIPVIPFMTSFLISFFKNAGYENGFIGAYVASTLFLVVLAVSTMLGCKDFSPVSILLRRIDRLAITIAIPSILVYYFELPPLPEIFLFSSLCGILIFATGYLQKDLILAMFKKT